MTMKLEVPKGTTFGKWEVVQEEPAINKVRRFLCKCECGHTKIQWLTSLRSGASKSCGKAGCRDTTNYGTHKMSETRVYNIWVGMKLRCDNPKATGYKNYGGRGIRYCERWELFDNFYADMGDAPEGMTLDRIDVDKDYSPDNCKWATLLDQANNTRKNRIIEWQGRTQTAAQWERELGFGRNSINVRLNAGWPLEQAMTEPMHRGSSYRTYRKAALVTNPDQALAEK